MIPFIAPLSHRQTYSEKLPSLSVSSYFFFCWTLKQSLHIPRRSPIGLLLSTFQYFTVIGLSLPQYLQIIFRPFLVLILFGISAQPVQLIVMLLPTPLPRQNINRRVALVVSLELGVLRVTTATSHTSAGKLRLRAVN